MLESRRVHSPTFNISTSLKSLLIFQQASSYTPVRSVLLREPRPCNHAKLLPELAERLGILYNNNDSLLYGAPCDIGRAIDQLGRVKLSRTRDAK